MPLVPEEPPLTPGTELSAFAARIKALQKRVNDAALAMHTQGLRPTVARIRAALGGGSPNDLAPALKLWKELVLPGLGLLPRGIAEPGEQTKVPVAIGDLAGELWQRAMMAASAELKGGPGARQLVARTEEAQLLREQVKALRDQLQREALAYGELRAQGARHEAIARAALTRAADAEAREREVLHELGAERQRAAELAAANEQLRTMPRKSRKSSARPRRKRVKSQPPKRPTKSRARRPAPIRGKPKSRSRTGPLRGQRTRGRAR
jgi:hypothetical protein